MSSVFSISPDFRKRLERGHPSIKDLVPHLPQGIAQVLSATPASAGRIKAAPSHRPDKQLARVKNIIPVFSAKGGVGKSSVAAHLALALQELGAKVGLLDADIYGPSIAKLFAVEGMRPELIEGTRFHPLDVNGLKLISMANLTTSTTPIIWRGPKASGALQHMLYKTEWPQLDYLILDMPPGTGDVVLTLLQSVGVAGSLIVTTPQDLSLLDVRKGIAMFQRMTVPILGLVENMVSHTCSQCGHIDHPFGKSVAKELAREMNIAYLSALPLSEGFQTDSDTSRVRLGDGDPIYSAMREIAVQTAIQLAELAACSTPAMIASDHS